VFLAQFAQELLGEGDRSCRKKPDIRAFVVLGFGGGVQPKALVIALNYRFVSHNVIRILPIWAASRPSDPMMDRGASAVPKVAKPVLMSANDKAAACSRILNIIAGSGVASPLHKI